ncbi:MAG: DUF1697 domain-containing protein [Ignavibacteria bacterium]|nr:DUF1697 domain-containing protein [Ignavibacteria bacterium]
MTTYCVLLRAVNVAGKNKLPMEALRQICNDLGAKNTTTYIQSGNVVFNHITTDIFGLQKQIEHELQVRSSVITSAFILPHPRVEEILDSIPFKHYDNKHLYITVLSKEADQHNTGLKKYASTNEDFFIIQNRIYLNLLNGYGNTKLNNTTVEKVFDCAATTRNYTTILKLAELCRKITE